MSNNIYKTKAANQSNSVALVQMLAVVLGFTYPFHTGFDSVVTINISYGDPVIAMITLLFVLLTFGKVEFPRILIIIALFVFALLLSLINMIVFPSGIGGQAISTAIVEILRITGALCWFIGVYLMISELPSNRIFLFLFPIILVGIGAVIHEIVMMSLTYDAANHRATGPFRNPNIFANFLIAVMFFSLLLREQAQTIPNSFGENSTGNILSVFFSSSAVISAFGVLITGSRGGIIALILSVIFAVVILTSKSTLSSFVKKLLTVFVVGNIILLLVQHINPFGVSRLMNTLAGVRSDGGRSDGWVYALEIWANYPILGIGPGQLDTHFSAVGAPMSQGHNTYLTIGTDLGLVGLLFFILIFVRSIPKVYKMLQNKNPIIPYVLPIIFATLVQGMVADIHKFRMLWISLALIYALQTS